MNNVFEVPSKLFDPYGGDDEIVSGVWFIEREQLPDGILQHLEDSSDLEVKIYLEHRKDVVDYNSGVPFEVELRIMTVDQKSNRTPLVIAKRNLALAHLWTHKQRQEGIRLKPGLEVLPYDVTYDDVCAIVFRYLLEGVLLTTPRLTIRWDDQGMVVYVNFGNSYISTREHCVMDEE